MPAHLCHGLVQCLVAANFQAAADAPLQVKSMVELRAALGAARPGTIVEIAPGIYRGGLLVKDLHGATGRPITLRGSSPTSPPVFENGVSMLQCSAVSNLQIENITIQGASGNGINIDDGGNFEKPSVNVVIRNVTILKTGGDGNHDGIKLSGVRNFRVERCTVDTWGTRGGSAVDMVGCHDGVIEACTFIHTQPGGTGVQTKGGTSNIQIRRNTFRNAGSRAVHAGGSTALQYFRPPLAKPPFFEARNITIEGNVIVGGDAAVAFTGIDGATFRFNTIYDPGRFALRILQETREEGFVACNGVKFTDNIIAFRRDRWSSGGVNIGPGTKPGSFEFARNIWFCMDDPARSRPALPVAETGGMVGVDPQFLQPEKLQFQLKPGSPAAKAGATALAGR